MNDIILTLAIGLVLGFQHAFETDHLISVTALVTQLKNPLKTALTGAFWGIGHTATLFAVGLVVLILKINISPTQSLILEFIVGAMLVLLGLQTLQSKNDQLHDHTHSHFHQPHHHQHAFTIGALHGLAGSGALMILVLTTIRSLYAGILYILIFGIGSIIGMTLVSLVVGIPYLVSIKKFSQTEKYLKTIAGVISIGFGIFLMYKIGVIEGLLNSII